MRRLTAFFENEDQAQGIATRLTALGAEAVTIDSIPSVVNGNEDGESNGIGVNGLGTSFPMWTMGLGVFPSLGFTFQSMTPYVGTAGEEPADGGNPFGGSPRRYSVTAQISDSQYGAAAQAVFDAGGHL